MSISYICLLLRFSHRPLALCCGALCERNVAGSRSKVATRNGRLQPLSRAPFRLGFKWSPHLSLQHMDQWGQMEVVVIYNDDQRYTRDFREDHFRSFIAPKSPGAFQPEITKNKMTP